MIYYKSHGENGLHLKDLNLQLSGLSFIRRQLVRVYVYPRPVADVQVTFDCKLRGQCRGKYTQEQNNGTFLYADQ